jgi:Glycosyltransferase family 87
VKVGRREVDWGWLWPRLLGGLVLGTLVVIGATERASRQRIGTDFHVFWQAGYDFSHGLPLYERLPGARKFLYPPFAAQVFQVLGVFPLRTAAWLFYFFSAGLVVVAAKISGDIIRKVEPARREGRLPLVLALLFSANFILNNLTMVQVNMVVFVLCLLGIQAFGDRREGAAGGWIAAATAIKITPVFFAMWAIIRGTRRSLAAVAGFGGLCLILPMLQRGFAQGVLDLTTYYHSFLQEFAGGRVIATYLNQNLASMIYRAAVPMSSGDTPPYDYAYLPSLASAAPLIYRITALIILIVLLAQLIRLRLCRSPLSALEISSVFLASHLLSGITWKAHLVTLLFVFYAFFSLDPRFMTRAQRIALGVAWGGIAAIGLGRDVIGSRLHHYVGGYSLIVWVMLLLFGLSVAWSQASAPRTSVVFLSENRHVG